EYFISREWKPGWPQSSVPACCIRLDVPADQKQATMRLVTAKVTLSPMEWQQFRRLGSDGQSQIDWLFGRLAAKDALRLLWHARHGERMFPADIVVEETNGILVAKPRGDAGPEPFPTIARASSEDITAGLAVFSPHAGIALERVRPRDPAAEKITFSDDELALLDRFNSQRDEWTARVRAAKEAVMRALGCRSVDTSGAVLACHADERTGLVKIARGSTAAVVYPEWLSGVMIAHTIREDDAVVAVSFCERERA